MPSIADLTIHSKNDHGFTPPATWKEALAAAYEGNNLRNDEAQAILNAGITLADEKLTPRITAELTGVIPSWSSLRTMLNDAFTRNAGTSSETPGLRSIFEQIGNAADLS